MNDHLDPPMGPVERALCIIIYLLLAALCVVLMSDWHNQAMAAEIAEANQAALDAYHPPDK